MNRYDNYDGEDFNGEYPNDQTYDPSEYGTQTYEGVNYYEPDNVYSDGLFQENSYQNNSYQENSYQDNTEYIHNSIDSPLYSDDYAETAQSMEHIQSHGYVKEPLTEAELADIKRQKAAARRKKLAARERRRKKRIQQAIIRCSILLLIIILLIVGLVKLIAGIWNHFEDEKKEKERSEFVATSEITTEEPVANIDEAIIAKELPSDREAALTLLAEQAETDTDIQSIYDNAATLPDIILRHLAANSEMKDFVIKYPAKISIIFEGDFTVDVPNNEVPLYLQFDERWGYADYSSDLIGLSGAGPTALSMACTYLKNDGSLNPIRIADYATEQGYLDADGNTHWTLMTDGATSLGFISEELDIDKEDMIDALQNDKLIICQMSSGDFTTSQSYIVIRDYKDGFFYINDPTSAARSAVGWDYKRLSKQINKMCTLVAGADDTQGGDIPSDDGQTGDTTEDDGQTGDTE